MFVLVNKNIVTFEFYFIFCFISFFLGKGPHSLIFVTLLWTKNFLNIIFYFNSLVCSQYFSSFGNLNAWFLVLLLTNGYTNYLHNFFSVLSYNRHVCFHKNRRKTSVNGSLVYPIKIIITATSRMAIFLQIHFFLRICVINHPNWIFKAFWGKDSSNRRWIWMTIIFEVVWWLSIVENNCMNVMFH